MVRLIHIADVKPVEVFEGRKTRGPITMRMTDDVIHRLLNTLDGPRDMYVVDPKTKKEVKITNDNYLLPDEQLFGYASVTHIEEKKEDSNEKAREEALKKQIEAMKIKKADDTKSEEVSIEPETKSFDDIEKSEETIIETEEKIAEMTDTLKDEDGKEIEVPTGKVDDEPSEIIPKTDIVEEKKAEVKAAVNNYTKNYSKNKKK